MAAVPQQEPAKPAKRRPKAEWTVFEIDDRETVTTMAAVGNFTARNADAACWQAAEDVRREDAIGPDGIRLVAIKASEVEAKTYRLRSTVERVKA